MTEDKIIYLDNAATTKADPEVIKIYSETAERFFANPASIHLLGVDANRELEKTREAVLSLLKLRNKKVIFNSGATEGNSLAIKGIALNYKNRGKHIISSKAEHPSVLENLATLEKDYGFEITLLDVDKSGSVSLDEVIKNIRNDTILVSLIAVNNETGAITDVKGIAKELKKYPKVMFHVDATQAIGKETIDYSDVNLITFSAHKFHGLKNSGALIFDNNIKFKSLNEGGGQEFNFRSGTNDLASAKALYLALEIALNKKEENDAKIRSFNGLLREHLRNNDEFHINSDENCSPYILNFSLIHKKAAVVVEALSNQGIMVSSVSACHSKSENESYVVKDMFKDDSLSHNTIRVSFSHLNSKEDVVAFINALDSIIKKVKDR